MSRAFAEVLAGGSRQVPRSVLVVQAEFAHDVASFVLSTVEAPPIREGWPVRINWGYDHGDTQSFYGYVNHVEPYYDVSPQHQEWMKFICIGATLILEQGTQRSWSYQTADTMVQEMANDAYLSADVEASDVVWPYMSTAGSYWQALCELADRVGYTLAGNGTEIRFMSQSAVIRRSTPGAPLFALNGSLVNFRPVVGKSTENAGRAIRIGTGIDPRTGQIFSVTDDGSSLPRMGPDKATLGFATPMTSVVADSTAEATAKIGAETQKARFTFQATAEAIGLPQVTQASVIYVAGVGSDYEGHWYVQQVEHEIRSTVYNMYLQLGRDARGAFQAVPAEPAPLRSDPYGVLSSAVPPSILVNNLWRSGWARRSVKSPPEPVFVTAGRFGDFGFGDGPFGG